MTDEEFTRLATEVLDGRPVDWTALSGSADPATLKRLAALRSVERLAVGRRSPADDVADPPQQWNGLDLIEPIGRGMFGEVWRAHDPQLGRDVALKLIAAADGDEAVQVLQEGRLLARVRHPNVATVFGATRVTAEVGIAMEYVPGVDLEAKVREHGPMAARDVVEIGIDLADALDAVHRAGVLHRDVKASNVKRASDGRVMLLDFGSGRELKAHAGEVGVESGTPRYLAPEVLRGAAATVQSDLYSLGVLLFYLLTARYPVDATSIEDLLHAHAQRQQARLPAPGVPRRLSRVIDAMLSVEPRRRPASAALVAAALGGRGWRNRALLPLVASVLIAIAAASLDRWLRPMPGAASLQPASRQIPWPIAAHSIGIPSRDGRWVPFVDRRQGALSLLNVGTGAVSRLTTDDELVHGHAVQSAASRDGSSVAYSWRLSDCTCDELRTIHVASGRQTMLWRSERGSGLMPTDWSSDDQTIAFRVVHDSTSEIVTVSASSAARVIARGQVAHGSFSRDSRYLAFDQADDVNGVTHLAIADLRTGQVSAPFASGFADRAPVWIGDTLVFESNRAGPLALWAAGFDSTAGRLTEPRLVRTDLGGLEPIAATSDGSLFYRRGEGGSGVFVGSMSGAQPQERMSTSINAAVSPDWAADGTSLAWIEEPPERPVSHLLRILDMRTRRDRVFGGLGKDFPLKMIGLNPRFAPDGRQILVRAAGRGGVRLVDLASGMESATLLAHRNVGDVEWDRTTEDAFYLDLRRGISRVNIATGRDDLVYAPPAGAFMGRGLALSPDGQQLAFTLVSPDAGRAVTIMIADRNGQNARALWTDRPAYIPISLPVLSAVPLLLGEWTRDGRRVLFARSEVLPSGYVRSDTELWGVPVSGGRPERLGLSVPGLRDIRPHPDGSRLAYTSFDERAQIWLLRNALPDPPR